MEKKKAQIGYSLVDKDNTEVSHWGDVVGGDATPPEILRLPNGDVVHSPDFSTPLPYGMRIVERWLEDNVVEGEPCTEETVKWEDGHVLVVRNYGDGHVRKRILKEALDYMKEQLEDASVSIAFDHGTFSFPCDELSRENIIDANLAVTAEYHVAAEFDWPTVDDVIRINHDELAVVGEAVFHKKAEYFAAYVKHKQAIIKLADIAALKAYDYTAGYGANKSSYVPVKGPEVVYDKYKVAK